MTTLSFKSRLGSSRAPELVEEDVRCNEERHVLANATSRIYELWAGYRKLGLTEDEMTHVFDYEPVPAQRTIRVRGRVVAHTQGEPLSYPFDTEE